MSKISFSKILTANDVGTTGSHQVGMRSKSDKEFLNFLPKLDQVKNPDARLDCYDSMGGLWQFRYIYYNNKLHDPKGTRDEYEFLGY